MILFFYKNICQASPEQMLLPIDGWYAEEAIWDMFFNKLQYLI